MNTTEASRLSIVGYLAAVGVKPLKVKNRFAWYVSPLQPETRISLIVDLKTNCWYDTGTRTAGNIMSLVAQLNQTEILGALIILQKPELSKPLFHFAEPKY